MASMNQGYSDVLVGLQYGDEGKAKIVDLVAPNYDIIARFNGGANAGHTIKTDNGTFTLQQVPSAVSNPNAGLYIGSGCIINPEKLVNEIVSLEKLGMAVKDRLVISPFASVIQPHHILFDRLIGGMIGTTNNGIGPAYSDRALRQIDTRRQNIRFADLISDFEESIVHASNNYSYFLESLTRTDREFLESQSPELGAGETLEEQQQASLYRFRSALEGIVELVEANPRYLSEAVEKGARVLFEGAQSVMLDVVRGTTPYVTSSATVAGAAYCGGDLSPRFHRNTIGVAKLLMSRVGRGPFASEFGGKESEEYCLVENGGKHTKKYEASHYDSLELLRSPKEFDRGIALRMLTNEYGSNTGRPRRVGALDLVQLQAAARDNGVDELYLTKADVLTHFAETPEGMIPLVTKYTDQRDESLSSIAPYTSREIRTSIEFIPCFTEDISGVREMRDLPKELGELVDQIEEVTGSKVSGVGTGPHRNQMAL